MSGAQQRRTPTAWLPSPVRQIDRWEVICKQVVHGSKRLVYRSRFLSQAEGLASATQAVRAQLEAEFRANVQS